MKRIILFCLLLVIGQSLFAQATTLQEGFENWPPTDWSFYYLGIAEDGWIQDFEGISHSGSHSAYSSINNDTCDNWLVTPQIQVESNEYDLKFWDYHDSVEFYDKASVLISTGSGDPSDGDFVEVFATVEPIPLEAWNEQIIDLSAYDGETIYVAFRYEGTWHKWYLDDVSIAPDIFIDGGLTEIVNPTGVSENTGTEDIIVTLTNFGTSDIQDVEVNWTVNGVSQPSFIGSSLNILPGNSLNLTLGSYDFDTDGLYTITAELVLAGDFEPANNTIDGTYTVASFQDGALQMITPEGMSPNTGVQDVFATIQNVGDNTMNLIEIDWTVDGVVQPTFSSSTLNLLPGNSTTVLIGTYDFALSGVYEIQATLNALGDINSDNDQYISYAAIDTFWESFEGSSFPPENWSNVFGFLENGNFGAPYDGEFYGSTVSDSNFFGTVQDTIYSPRLDIQPGDTYSFYLNRNDFLSLTHTLIWKDGVTGEVNTIQTVPSTPDNVWTQVTIDISAAQGANYIGLTSSSGSYGESKIDLFESTAKLHLYDHDLGIKNGDITFLAKENTNETYQCVIKNYGSLAVLGAEYTVKLMEAPGVELASVSGVNLNSWEEAIISISHSFNGIDSHRLYFEIEYSSDQELGNNTFRESTIHVVPSTAIFDEMAPKGDIVLNMPFDSAGDTQTLGQDDISQTLYESSNFENPGTLYGFVYSYDNLLGADVVKELPLKVWISQTQTSDLSAGYLPINEFTLVFDGVIEILPGAGREVYIPFDQPIGFTGIDNIVVQDYQYDPEWPPAVVRFYGSGISEGPVKTVQNFNVFDLDPENPPTEFIASPNITYTRFVIDPEVQTSTVSGTVTDITNTPIEGANVEVVGTSIEATTDSNGDYQLAPLPFGEYEIKASKFGYFDEILSPDLNSSVFTLDFTLQERAIVEISGRVVGSNDLSLPLENVEIEMNGYVNDNTSTNGLGEFNFNNVYGGDDYELTFTLYGYEVKTIIVEVVDESIDLGDVVLDQDFISPFDVVVETNSEAVVTWKNPLESSKVKLQNDFGVDSNSFTNEPNENVWLGNIFSISEITTLTNIEIRTGIFPNAVDFVSIDVFDFASEQILASSEPFLMQQDSLMTINIPNIVVYDDIVVAVHWQNNPESTNTLVIDYSDPSIPNTAVIKYPGEPIFLMTDYFSGFPEASFHVRVNTLDDGTPDTNNEILTYNVRRGLASEFPDTSNWELLTPTPVTELSLIDPTWEATDPSLEYRYAVETIYSEDNSEFTFSNIIFGGTLGIGENELEEGILIHPVPAHTSLYVVQNLDVQGTSIQIFDITGKLLNTVPLGEENLGSTVEINVSVLSNGVYIMRYNANGKSINKRFIVAH